MLFIRSWLAARRPIEIQYPKLNDVRWTILAFHISFVIFSTNSNSFNRTSAQFFAAAGTCILLDSLLLYLKGIPIVPLSGFITSMGITLFCDSPHVWPYALVAAISILSKHIIRIRGWHVFNPNNFGIVVGFLYLNQYMTVTAGRWGGFSIGTVIVAALGVLLAYRARRWILAFSYVFSYVMGIQIRSDLTLRPLITVGAPMTGAAFQLFVFYMITDPLTTPRSAAGQISFGLGLGAIETVLRHYEYKYSPFLALFITSAIYSLFKAIHGWENPRPWALGRRALNPGEPLMKVNMGNKDRVFRVFAAVILAVLGVTRIISPWFILLSIIMATLASVSFCPLYTLFGISTCPSQTPKGVNPFTLPFKEGYRRVEGWLASRKARK